MHADRIKQPSQLERTLNCPGWGHQAAGAPSVTSRYAAEGSVAHYLAEQCLKFDYDADIALGSTGWYDKEVIGIAKGAVSITETDDCFAFPVDDEMVENVQLYLDEIRRKKQLVTGGIFMVEKKLDLEHAIPGMFGTADHIIVEPLNRMYVDDYKNGGLVVEIGEKVGDNPQLSAYALMVIGKGNPYGVNEVIATITQPKTAYHPDGAVRSICYTVAELYAWGKDVLIPGVKAAEQIDAPLCAGGWCQWCEGKATCPEILRQMFDVTGAEHDGSFIPTAAVIPSDPVMLDTGKIDRVLQFADIFEDWLKSIRAEAYRRLLNSEPNAPSQFKLVDGRMGNRNWLTGKDLVKELRGFASTDELITRKPVSPAVAEKVLKKAGLKKDEISALLDPLIAPRIPGKPAMVPVDDKRAPAADPIDVMFSKT